MGTTRFAGRRPNRLAGRVGVGGWATAAPTALPALSSAGPPRASVGCKFSTICIIPLTLPCVAATWRLCTLQLLIVVISKVTPSPMPHSRTVGHCRPPLRSDSLCRVRVCGHSPDTLSPRECPGGMHCQQWATLTCSHSYLLCPLPVHCLAQPSIMHASPGDCRPAQTALDDR